MNVGIFAESKQEVNMHLVYILFLQKTAFYSLFHFPFFVFVFTKVCFQKLFARHSPTEMGF